MMPASLFSSWLGGLGEAEVDDLHLPVLGDEHVGRRHVAVDDVERLPVGAAHLVGVGEALADLGGDEAGGLDGEALPAGLHVLDDLLEIGAVDVLHHDEVGVLADADVEDLGHVGVREVRGEARLVEEHGDEALLLAQRREDALDGDLLLEALDARALGEEHLRHAARGEALEDPVTLLLVPFHAVPDLPGRDAITGPGESVSDVRGAAAWEGGATGRAGAAPGRPGEAGGSAAGSR